MADKYSSARRLRPPPSSGIPNSFSFFGQRHHPGDSAPPEVSSPSPSSGVGQTAQSALLGGADSPTAVRSFGPQVEAPPLGRRMPGDKNFNIFASASTRPYFSRNAQSASWNPPSAARFAASSVASRGVDASPSVPSGREGVALPLGEGISDEARASPGSQNAPPLTGGGSLPPLLSASSCLSSLAGGKQSSGWASFGGREWRAEAVGLAASKKAEKNEAEFSARGLIGADFRRLPSSPPCPPVRRSGAEVGCAEISEGEAEDLTGIAALLQRVRAATSQMEALQQTDGERENPELRRSAVRWSSRASSLSSSSGRRVAASSNAKKAAERRSRGGLEARAPVSPYALETTDSRISDSKRLSRRRMGAPRIQSAASPCPSVRASPAESREALRRRREKLFLQKQLALHQRLLQRQLLKRQVLQRDLKKQLELRESQRKQMQRRAAPPPRPATSSLSFSADRESRASDDLLPLDPRLSSEDESADGRDSLLRSLSSASAGTALEHLLYGSGPPSPRSEGSAFFEASAKRSPPPSPAKPPLPVPACSKQQPSLRPPNAKQSPLPLPLRRIRRPPQRAASSPALQTLTRFSRESSEFPLPPTGAPLPPETSSFCRRRGAKEEEKRVHSRNPTSRPTPDTPLRSASEPVQRADVQTPQTPESAASPQLPREAPDPCKEVPDREVAQDFSRSCGKVVCQEDASSFAEQRPAPSPPASGDFGVCLSEKNISLALSLSDASEAQTPSAASARSCTKDPTPCAAVGEDAKEDKEAEAAASTEGDCCAEGGSGLVLSDVNLQLACLQQEVEFMWLQKDPEQQPLQRQSRVRDRRTSFSRRNAKNRGTSEEAVSPLAAPSLRPAAVASSPKLGGRSQGVAAPSFENSPLQTERSSLDAEDLARVLNRSRSQLRETTKIHPAARGALAELLQGKSPTPCCASAGVPNKLPSGALLHRDGEGHTAIRARQRQSKQKTDSQGRRSEFAEGKGGVRSEGCASSLRRLDICHSEVMRLRARLKAKEFGSLGAAKDPAFTHAETDDTTNSAKGQTPKEESSSQNAELPSQQPLNPSSLEATQGRTGEEARENNKREAESREKEAGREREEERGANLECSSSAFVKCATEVSGSQIPSVSLNSQNKRTSASDLGYAQCSRAPVPLSVFSLSASSPSTEASPCHASNNKHPRSLFVAQQSFSGGSCSSTTCSLGGAEVSFADAIAMIGNLLPSSTLLLDQTPSPSAETQDAAKTSLETLDSKTDSLNLKANSTSEAKWHTPRGESIPPATCSSPREENFASPSALLALCAHRQSLQKRCALSLAGVEEEHSGEDLATPGVEESRELPSREKASASREEEEEGEKNGDEALCGRGLQEKAAFEKAREFISNQEEGEAFHFEENDESPASSRREESLSLDTEENEEFRSDAKDGDESEGENDEEAQEKSTAQELLEGLRVIQLLKEADEERASGALNGSDSSVLPCEEKSGSAQTLPLSREPSLKETSSASGGVVETAASPQPLKFLSDPLTAASAIFANTSILLDSAVSITPSEDEAEATKKALRFPKDFERRRSFGEFEISASTEESEAGDFRLTDNEALSLECAFLFRGFGHEASLPPSPRADSSVFRRDALTLADAVEAASVLEKANSSLQGPRSLRRSSASAKSNCQAKDKVKDKRHFQTSSAQPPASQGWVSLLWKEAFSNNEFTFCGEEAPGGGQQKEDASRVDYPHSKENARRSRERSQSDGDESFPTPGNRRVETVYDEIAHRCDALDLAALLNRASLADANSEAESSSDCSSCAASRSVSRSESCAASVASRKTSLGEPCADRSPEESEEDTAVSDASETTSSSEDSSGSSSDEVCTLRSRSSKKTSNSSSSRSDSLSSESPSEAASLEGEPLSSEEDPCSPLSSSRPKSLSQSSDSEGVSSAESSPRRSVAASSVATKSVSNSPVPSPPPARASLSSDSKSLIQRRPPAPQGLLSGVTPAEAAERRDSSRASLRLSSKSVQQRPRPQSAASSAQPKTNPFRFERPPQTATVSERPRTGLSAKAHQFLREMFPPFKPQDLRPPHRAESAATRRASPKVPSSAKNCSSGPPSRKPLSAAAVSSGLGWSTRMAELELHRRQLRSVKMAGLRQRLKRFAATHSDAHALCMAQFRRSMRMPEQNPVFCVERSKGHRAKASGGDVDEEEGVAETATLESFLVAALRRRGWVRNEDSRSSYFDFKWRLRDAEEDYASLRRQQLFNHFQGHEALTTKAGLANSLRSLKSTDGSPVQSFFPRCYDLSVLSDCTAFLLDFCRCEAATVLLLYLSYTADMEVEGAATVDSEAGKSATKASLGDTSETCLKKVASETSGEHREAQTTSSCGGSSVCRLCAEDSRAFSTEAVVLLWLSLQLLQAWLPELDPDAFLDARLRAFVGAEDGRTPSAFRGSLSPTHIEAFVEYSWVRRLHPGGFVSQWKKARRRAARSLGKRSVAAEFYAPLKARRSAPPVALVLALLRRVQNKWSLWNADLGVWATRVLERTERAEITEKTGKTGKTEVFSERTAICAEEKDAPSPPLNIWVVKPSNNARASGIKLFSNPLDILRTGRGLRNRLVQRYVERPLLLFGKKFDLRLWVFVRSFSPLKAFLFTEPYLRLCSEKYDASDLTNRFKHLCNWSVNKTHNTGARRPNTAGAERPSTEAKEDRLVPTSEKTEPPPNAASALPLAFLKTILRKRSGSATYWEDVLLPQLRYAVLQVLRAAQPLVVQRASSFEVYGFDVLIDDSLRPWVLEANLSPSCSARALWMKQLLADMTSQLLELLLPPASRPRSAQLEEGSSPPARTRGRREPAGKEAQSARGRGRWEILFDETRDEREAVEAFPRVLPPFETPPSPSATPTPGNGRIPDSLSQTHGSQSQSRSGKVESEKIPRRSDSAGADERSAREAWISSASREAAEKLFGALYAFGSAHKDKKTNAGKRLHWQRLVVEGRSAASANKVN